MSDISADQRARAKAAAANAAVASNDAAVVLGASGVIVAGNRRRLGRRRACWRSGRGHARSLQLWRLADCFPSTAHCVSKKVLAGLLYSFASSRLKPLLSLNIGFFLKRSQWSKRSLFRRSATDVADR